MKNHIIHTNKYFLQLYGIIIFTWGAQQHHHCCFLLIICLLFTNCIFYLALFIVCFYFEFFFNIFISHKEKIEFSHFGWCFVLACGGKAKMKKEEKEDIYGELVGTER